MKIKELINRILLGEVRYKERQEEIKAREERKVIRDKKTDEIIDDLYKNIEEVVEEDVPSKIGATIEDMKQSNKMLKESFNELEEAFDGLEGAVDNLNSKVDILVEMAKRGEI